MRLNNASKFKPFYDNQSPLVILNTSTSIANAISNPFTYFFIYNDNWCSYAYSELWNKNASISVNNNAQKTIYSPSPTGFIEPYGNAFTGFTNDGNVQSNSNNWNYSSIEGYDFIFFCNQDKTGGTIKFWALGFRDAFSGRPGNGGKLTELNSGNYWTLQARDNAHAYNLNFYNWIVQPMTYFQKSEALLIRAVKL